MTPRAKTYIAFNRLMVIHLHAKGYEAKSKDKKVMDWTRKYMYYNLSGYLTLRSRSNRGYDGTRHIVS